MKKQNINNIFGNLKQKNCPIMLYDLIQLKENIKKILYMKDKYNIEFLFPVKAFPDQKILNLFSNFNFGFDIANDNEFNLIKDIISDDTIISINGVSKNFKNSKSGDVIYHLNSILDINSVPLYNGIRINTYQKNKSEFSRFGITVDDINEIDLSQIESLSFHFYDENKHKKAKIITKLYQKIYNKNMNLKYIDLGGNWDILNIEDFEESIIEIRKYIPSKIKILIEVGENWFGNCGYLVTKVVGKNKIENKQIIYINACKESVAKWSVLKPINLNNNGNMKKTYIISGSSCYEKDIFSVFKGDIDISIGDQIVFIGLNGYSYAWRKEFNGLESPEVIFYE